MSEGYDVHGRGDGSTALDVRALLEDASWAGERESLDPHEHWSSGRRRRSRKRAGAGVLGGVALVTVAGLVWQAGVFGGEVDPLEPHVAHLPSGLTTFVLAAPGAGERDVVDTDAQVQVADPAALVGTSWELTHQVWGSDRRASEVIGSDAETVFSFGGAPGRGWGFVADDCGGGWFQQDLQLRADGSFTGGDLSTTDQGCPPPAQAAEDFWLEVLADGGSLHQLDHDWLLLSVDVAAADAEQAPPTSIQTEAPGTTADGTGGEGPDPEGSPTAGPTPPAVAPTPPTVAAPTVPPTVPGTPSLPSAPAAPTTSATTTSPAAPTAAPTAPGTAPTSPAPTSQRPTSPVTPPDGSPPPDGGPAFMDPDEQWVGQPWPASGGGVYAPSVRAGVHEGFDRVVLDLAAQPGATGPGWYAVYTPNPLRDGSGAPMEIAGDSVLEVVLNSMTYPEPGDPVYDGGDFGLDTHRLDAVQEVIRTTPWEGQVQLFIGMQGEPRPYRVFLLHDPLRLVVDVQTS